MREGVCREAELGHKEVRATTKHKKMQGRIFFFLVPMHCALACVCAIHCFTVSVSPFSPSVFFLLFVAMTGWVYVRVVGLPACLLLGQPSGYPVPSIEFTH